MQPEIGGYLGLELPIKRLYHIGAIELNSGRNALKYIINSQPPRKIFIPKFTCTAVLSTIINSGIKFSFYSIDETLEPIFDFDCIKKDEAFLYTNYFGIKDQYIKKLADIDCRFIIDNAQSFFSRQVGDFETYYSPRKFFGLPDGGYAYAKRVVDLKRDYSSKRSLHLMIRHDDSAQAGYKEFVNNEKLISITPLKSISSLSNRILRSIDYRKVATARKKNFQLLHHALHNSNLLPICDVNEFTALSYPFLSKNTRLRQSLISQNIFTASYWPEVAQNKFSSSLERHYASQIVHLPIDQRYGAKEMSRILECIS